MMAQGKTLENVFYRDGLFQAASVSMMRNVSGQHEENAYFCDRRMLGEVPVLDAPESRYKTEKTFFC